MGRIVAEGDVASLRLGGLRRVRAGLRDVEPAAIRAALGRIPGVTEVEVIDGEVARVTATIDGDIDPLIKLLAASTVVDLAIEEPDLEESVLSLYGTTSHEVTRG